MRSTCGWNISLARCVALLATLLGSTARAIEAIVAKPLATRPATAAGKTSAPYLHGTIKDFKNEHGAAGFVFINPNDSGAVGR